MKQFGSLKRLRAATVEELMAVPASDAGRRSGAGRRREPAGDTPPAPDAASDDVRGGDHRAAGSASAARPPPPRRCHARSDGWPRERADPRGRGRRPRHAAGPARDPLTDVPPPIDPTSTETQPLDVVVVTGLSGAGKNSAGRVLEDLGFFVVENLPPALLLPMVELGARGDLRRFAAVVDVRSRRVLQRPAGGDPGAGRRRPPARGSSTCTPATTCLIRRYESNRREHPLQGSGRLIDGIEAERRLLTGIAGEADLWVDTSDLNVHQLRATLENAFARRGQTPPLTADRAQLRLQVRACRWTPTSSSTPASCPTRTGCPSCARTPARTPTWRLRCWGRGRPGPSSPATSRCSACSSPATGARASAT
jgi:hypothetical protein